MLRDVPQERDSLTNTPAPESEANLAKRTAEQASARVSGPQPGSSYWLLVRNENGGLEVLATDLAGGEEALLSSDTRRRLRCSSDSGTQGSTDGRPGRPRPGNSSRCSTGP